MGCYPLGKIVSRALGRCNGHQKGRRRNACCASPVYSPPPTFIHSRSAAKTVTFSNDNTIFVIPPEPIPASTATRHRPDPPPPKACSAAAGDPTDNPQPRPAGGPEPHGYHRPEPVPAPAHRYMPSPLPVWEERPRREYFGGEYNYFPTPIREGIYSIATDANRLTTIFSEENPNACVIV